MKCAQCNNDTDEGRNYEFYYGKRLSSYTRKDTKIRGSSTVTTTTTNSTFKMNGSDESFICNSCVLKKAGKKVIENSVVLMIFSGIIFWITLQFSDTGFIALLFFGVLAYSIISMVVKILQLFRVHQLSKKDGKFSYDVVSKHDLGSAGSEVAIGLYKKSFGKLNSDDVFFTPKEYSKLR